MLVTVATAQMLVTVATDAGHRGNGTDMDQNIKL